MRIFLNVYDLVEQGPSPIFGVYHTGVEINGVEFSFAKEAGIYEQTPKEAAGARLRETVEMGECNMSMAAIRSAIYSISEEKLFNGNSYHLIKKNCNHFSEAVCQKLLSKSIPSRINRLAYWGKYVSCLLPESLNNGSGPGPAGSEGTLGNCQRHSFDAFKGNGYSLSQNEERKSFFGYGGSRKSSSKSDGEHQHLYDVDEVRKQRLAALDRQN